MEDDPGDVSGREVFVLGVDDHHRDALRRAGDRVGVTVHPLLRYEDVREARAYDIDALLEKAERQLRDHEGSVDGITTYWDFPSLGLAAILCERRDLPTAGLRPVLVCEHKFWARVVQEDVVAEEIPAYTAVDPFDDGDAIDLPFPFWLKPVKSYSGHLGFRIDTPEDLDEALSTMRARIGRLGRPFQSLLDRVDDLPDPVGEVPGTAALAEGILEGHQCTLEGHVHDGEVHVHGIFDIERAEDGSTFHRYVYPSQVDDDAKERMHGIASGVMRRIDYGSGAFNIEFFLDGDRTWILEINPRISQEHTDLMGWVDGATNLEVMLRTALGERPEIEPRAGAHRVAGKQFLRRTGDAHIERVPTRGEVARIEERLDPCRVQVKVPEGVRISDLPDQESRNAVLAYAYAAAEDIEALDRKLDEAVAALRFDLTER